VSLQSNDNDFMHEQSTDPMSKQSNTFFLEEKDDAFIKGIIGD